MRQTTHSLIAITCAIATVPAWSAEPVDYNQRLTSSGAVPEYPIPYVVPSTAEVKAVVDRIGHYVISNTSLRVFDNKTGVEIANADLAHPNPNAVVDNRYTPFNRWDYPNGVTWSAFDRITDLTGDKTYAEHAIRVYDWIFTWSPYFHELEKQTGKGNLFSHIYQMHALDHCGAISAGLIRTQLRSPDPRFRKHIDVVADYISNGQFRLPDGTLARQRPQDVSVWSDDFYMGISFLAQMGRLGDHKYWDDAVKQVTQGSARLFDERVCLYDHGWSENTDGYDPRIHWCRGNGWAALAMTELLAELPADYPGRDKVLHYYRQMMRGLVEQQDASGLWHNVLDRHDTFLETSGSAMFAYALARGVNEGWLSPIFGPPAITGWNGLVTRVLPDGRVSGICEGTTYASDMTYYTYRGAGSDTIFVGPVLYSGAEVIRLIQNPKLQISEPKPNAVNSALLMRPKR